LPAWRRNRSAIQVSSPSRAFERTGREGLRHAPSFSQRRAVVREHPSSAAIRLAQPFLRSPERGAQTLLYLATASEVEGISGGYFHDMRPTESSKASLDSDSARQLWEISAAMVGIS
jgi:hypothetical protein